MTNEELLRQGECPQPYCIETAYHTGPCSGERPEDLRAQVARLETANAALAAALRDDSECIITYGGRPRGWSCFDEENRASDPKARYGEEWRQHILSGQRRCRGCRNRAALSDDAGEDFALRLSVAGDCEHGLAYSSHACIKCWGDGTETMEDCIACGCMTHHRQGKCLRCGDAPQPYEGWLPPEVREQARQAIKWVMERVTPAGGGGWRMPRTSLERLGVALERLEGK